MGKTEILIQTGWNIKKLYYPEKEKAESQGSLGFVLVKILQKQNQRKRYLKWFIVRNWLIWLWRLRNPMIWCLQAGVPEKAGGIVPVQKGEPAV